MIEVFSVGQAWTKQREHKWWTCEIISETKSELGDPAYVVKITSNFGVGPELLPEITSTLDRLTLSNFLNLWTITSGERIILPMSVYLDSRYGRK